MPIDIDKIKDEIVYRLKPMEPEKIILFGSYAYGTPDEESDLDLFLLKNNLEKKETRNYRLSSQKALIDLQKKYSIGIDLLVDSSERVQKRIEKLHDQFYTEIMQRGKVIYAK